MPKPAASREEEQSETPSGRVLLLVLWGTEPFDLRPDRA
jgi:hypothetical protein